MPADFGVANSLFVGQFTNLECIAGTDDDRKTASSEFLDYRFKKRNVRRIVQVKPNIGFGGGIAGPGSRRQKRAGCQRRMLEFRGTYHRRSILIRVGGWLLPNCCGCVLA